MENVPEKYWRQRYRLFSNYDAGIAIASREEWYSVTPEKIGRHIAQRVAERAGGGAVAVDLCCGCGGSTVQLARALGFAIGVDIDAERAARAKRNAEVSGCLNSDFVVGDCRAFGRLFRALAVDAVHVSHPWGGPEYKQQETFRLDDAGGGVSGFEAFDAARRVSPNIAMYVPLNTDIEDVRELCRRGGFERCDVEVNELSHRPRTVTLYFGDLV